VFVHVVTIRSVVLVEWKKHASRVSTMKFAIAKRPRVYRNDQRLRDRGVNLWSTALGVIHFAALM